MRLWHRRPRPHFEEQQRLMAASDIAERLRRIGADSEAVRFAERIVAKAKRDVAKWDRANG